MALLLKLVWDTDVRRVHVSELTYDQVQAAVVRVFSEKLAAPGEEEAILLEFRDETVPDEAVRTLTRETFPDLVVLYARQQHEHQKRPPEERLQQQRALRLHLRAVPRPPEMAPRPAIPPLVEVKTELEDWAPRNIPMDLQAVKKELEPKDIPGGLQVVKKELEAKDIPGGLQVVEKDRRTWAMLQTIPVGIDQELLPGSPPNKGRSSSRGARLQAVKKEEAEEGNCSSNFSPAALGPLLPVKLEDPKAVCKAARELLRQARKAELKADRITEKQRLKDAKVAEKLAKQARKMRRKVAKRIDKVMRRVARRAKRALLLAKRKGKEEQLRLRAEVAETPGPAPTLPQLLFSPQTAAAATSVLAAEHGRSSGGAKRPRCEALLRRQAAKAARKEIKRRLREFRKKARKDTARSEQRGPAEDTDYRASAEDNDAVVNEGEEDEDDTQQESKEAALTPLAEPPAADCLSEELQRLVESGFRGFLEAEAAAAPCNL